MEEYSEPVSPTGQYFTSSVISVSVIGVLESEIPIDNSNSLSLLKDVFLPINPRFSSLMVLSLYLSFYDGGIDIVVCCCHVCSRLIFMCVLLLYWFCCDRFRQFLVLSIFAFTRKIIWMYRIRQEIFQNN